MIRRLAAALFFSLVATTAAHAQSSTAVCDNRFERYLKGHFIEDGELMPFIGD